MAAFLDNPNFSIWSIFGMFLTAFLVCMKIGTKHCQNFCFIGKNHHNFLAPRMIELACKTFMPIQTLDLQSANMILSFEAGLKNALK